MASAPNDNLPLFYKTLVPLNSNQHANFRAKPTDKALWLANEHAVPITVEEFPMAQRFFPIVFSSGPNPVPLALMGLNEGVNTFFDAEGGMTTECYVPAYVRRYPFLLAKLSSDSDHLSLCFDASSGLVGEFEDGERLFNEEAQPTEATQNILRFNENFEQAGMKTKAFIDELKKADLLMDGEVSITRENEPPYVYRGFQMVNQDKLRDVRGDQLRSWNQSGLLPLVFAHLFSLTLMRDIFSKQAALGKAPGQKAPANA